MEAAYQVGGVSAPAWAAFGDIAQVVFDEAGRLYVLDSSTKSVTIVSPDGALAGTVGGPGDGPGELAFPTGLARDRDGVLIIFDQARRSFVTYDSLGGFLRSFPLDPDIVAPAGPLGIDPGGRVFATRDERVDGDGAGEAAARELLLFSLPTGSATADPVAADPMAADPMAAGPMAAGPTAEIAYAGWFPPTPAVRDLTPEETGGMRVRLPPVIGFHPALHAVALPDGRLAVVDSTDYRVRFVGGADPAADVVRALSPRPVDDAVREAEKARRTRAIQEAPPRLMQSNSDGVQSEVANEAILRLELARIDGMGFHDVVPTLRDLGVDADGNLWVGRSGSAPDRAGPIDVVAPDGEYVGTLAADRISMPDAFGPNGLVAFITVDDLGATRVDVGRLVGGAPSGR